MQKLTLLKNALIMLLTALLASCVVPSSNIGSANSIHQAANYTLPTTPSTNNAVVYFVQPYHTVDVVLVGGAISDSFQYSGSNVTVTQAGQSQKSLLGKLTSDHTLCFIASPGTYNVNFDSTGGVPRNFNRSIHLAAGSTQIYGLTANTPMSSTSQLSFNQLSLNEGKYYVQKNPPATCKSLQTLSTATAIYKVNFTVVNHSATPFNVMGNTDTQQNKTVELLPNSTVTFSRSIISDEFKIQHISISDITPGAWGQRKEALLELNNYNDKTLIMCPTPTYPVGFFPTTTCNQQKQGQNYTINCKVTLNRSM